MYIRRRPSISTDRTSRGLFNKTRRCQRVLPAFARSSITNVIISLNILYCSLQYNSNILSSQCSGKFGTLLARQLAMPFGIMEAPHIYQVVHRKTVAYTLAMGDFRILLYIDDEATLEQLPRPPAYGETSWGECYYFIFVFENFIVI